MPEFLLNFSGYKHARRLGHILLHIYYGDWNNISEMFCMGGVQDVEQHTGPCTGGWRGRYLGISSSNLNCQWKYSGKMIKFSLKLD